MKPVSVLLLAADPAAREALERPIQDAGHTPLVAQTGPEALALLSSLRPPVAVVDLDQLGEEAFSLLREVPNSPVFSLWNSSRSSNPRRRP